MYRWAQLCKLAIGKEWLGFLGHPQQVTLPRWPCSTSAQFLLWEHWTFKLFQLKPSVVSQYKPWATKTADHSQTGYFGYLWGTFGHFLSVQIKYSFFVSLLKINQSSFQFGIDCNLYLLFFDNTFEPSPSNLDLSTGTAQSLGAE